MEQTPPAEELTHRFFIVTLIAKGALGLVQIASAVALYFGVLHVLPRLLQSIVAAELSEDHNDFLAARILSLIRVLPSTDVTFYTVYFMAHGLLHVAVVAALLLGSSWAYPAAIAVLAVFIVYQLSEWMAVGGVMLLVLSAIDLLVIYLTLQEFRHRFPR